MVGFYTSEKHSTNHFLAQRLGSSLLFLEKAYTIQLRDSNSSRVDYKDDA